MKNRQRFYILLAAVTAAFCLISFCISFEKKSVFYISFAFGLLASALQLYTLPKAFKGDGSARNKVYGVPLANVSLYYLAAQLLICIALMGFSRWIGLWLVFLLSGIALLVALVGFIAADAARAGSHQRGQYRKHARSAYCRRVTGSC